MMAKKKLIMINSKHNCAPEYVIKKTGDVILCNTRPPPEGGTGKSLVLTLPTAAQNTGRSITIKDAGAYAHINNIVIERSSPDLIEGGNTRVVLTDPSTHLTFVSDGIDRWHQIG